MDCERIRERIAEDPARSDPEITAHTDGCAACAAYAARAMEAERRIQQALRFDVQALKAAGQVPVAPARGLRGRATFAAVAAACVAGVALWVGLGGSPVPVASDVLAADVLAHWFDEPESWVRSDVQVSEVALNTALDGQAELDLGMLGTVTYARSCLVSGQWVPHLVVQGQAGPVMLLLIPARPVSDTVPLRLPDQGINGRLVPHRGGSIAVMGEDGESFEAIELRIAEAVQWTI